LPQTETSTPSKLSIAKLPVVMYLASRGYCIVPLNPGTKIPMVKWKIYQTICSTEKELINWWGQWPNADIGIITGPVSGIMVLDYDKKPYPDNDHAYIETRRGRHYYYQYHEGDLHGLQVRDGIDIPRLAKFYDIPAINEGRIPLQPTYIPKGNTSTSCWDDKNPPAFDLITNCDFIQWFRERRSDPSWDGRYPLARAYAANVLKTVDPDTDLGPGYRHADAILNNTTRPISCAAIGQHWRCPYMDDNGFCKKAPGITTPYGLAKRMQR
jgi:hypothetical protein